MEKFRARNFCAVLYPDDPTHANAVALLSQGYKFSAILHDRDVYDADDTDDDTLVGQPKKPHWHVIIKFPQARWNTAVSQELGVLENYFQKCNSVDDYLVYMVHYELPHKAQYERSEVFGNMRVDLERALAKVKTPDEKALEVVDIIDSLGYCDMRTVIVECAKAGRFADLRQMGSWVPYLISSHNEQIERQVDGDIRRAQFTHAMLTKGKNGRSYAETYKEIET